MIYIILIFISILSLEYIIPINQNDSRKIRFIKNLSTILIILGIIGLYFKFKVSNMLYSLFIIYTLSVFMNLPLKEFFNNKEDSMDHLEKSLLPKTLSFSKLMSEKEKNSKVMINSFYPDEILYPDPYSLKPELKEAKFKGPHNTDRPISDLDDNRDFEYKQIFKDNKFQDASPTTNTELEEIKQNLENKFWDVSINNIYSNKDDKSFIPIDKYKKLIPNNFKVEKLNSSKTEEYFPALNILGNLKWILIIFVIFLLLLYVYDIGY